MAHYYFHVRDEYAALDDQDGLELRSPGAAVGAGVLLVRALAAGVSDPESICVIIVGEDGEIVARVKSDAGSEMILDARSPTSSPLA